MASTKPPSAGVPDRDIFRETEAPLMGDPAPSTKTVEVENDMDVTRLDEVNGWFWMVGSRNNVSQLHHQKVILRQIILTDRAWLHLVWFDRTIYIKPLPNYLLNYKFVHERVSAELEPTVIGFLRTYCKLIASETDLAVAHEYGLINKDVEWEKWYCYRESIMALTADRKKSARYQYGELRLPRLNMVWRLTRRGIVYFTVHRDYNTYFQQYFSLFIAAFAIVATILTAMQVLVGIDDIPQEVINVSYWFGIAAMIVILACLTPVIVLFTGLFLWNVARAMYSGFRPPIKVDGQRHKETV